MYGLQKFPVLAMVLDFSSLYQASGGGCLRVCSTCSSPGLTWTSVVRLNCISWGPSILKPTHLPCTPREVLDPKANATSIPQAAPFPHRGEEAAWARPGRLLYGRTLSENICRVFKLFEPWFYGSYWILLTLKTMKLKTMQWFWFLQTFDMECFGFYHFQKVDFKFFKLL